MEWLLVLDPGARIDHCSRNPNFYLVGLAMFELEMAGVDAGCRFITHVAKATQGKNWIRLVIVVDLKHPVPICITVNYPSNDRAGRDCGGLAFDANGKRAGDCDHPGWGRRRRRIHRRSVLIP